MTAIAVTYAVNGRAFPQSDLVIPVKLAATVTALQAGYQLAAGTFGVAAANGSGTQQFRGIFLEGGGAGQVVPLLIRGFVYGFAVSGLNCDAILYLSDTAGALDDSAGTMTVRCGRVGALTDGTKLAYIDALWNTVWS